MYGILYTMVLSFFKVYLYFCERKTTFLISYSEAGYVLFRVLWLVKIKFRTNSLLVINL